jgi:dipeptide transport system permease protein
MDVVARVIFGARISLIIAFIAAGLACSAAGRRAALLLLSIILVALIATGLYSVIAAIVITDWTRFCRVVCAETVALARMDHVVAARTIGFGWRAILFREILPNVVPMLFVLLILEMGIEIVVEAILSSVGLSVASDTPTWGGMIADDCPIVRLLGVGSTAGGDVRHRGSV